MTDPLLSVTVPEKLPIACPYSSDGTENTIVHANAAKNTFLLITHPLLFVLVQRRVVRRCLLGSHSLQERKHKPKIAILDVSLDEMHEPTPNLKHNKLKKNDVGKLLLNLDCVKATCLHVAAK